GHPGHRHRRLPAPHARRGRRAVLDGARDGCRRLRDLAAAHGVRAAAVVPAAREAARAAHRAPALASAVPAAAGRVPRAPLGRDVLGRRPDGAGEVRARSLPRRSGHVPYLMTHSAFQPAGKTFELEADYVVVGSGAGGATAAVTLARGGAKVIVVEAGPWRDPADYPSSVYGAMRDMLDGWGATLTRGRAYWPIVQGALVGGSTGINSAIAVRTPGDVFERWQEETGVGGDFAERIWQLQDELERELNAEEVPEASRGRSNLLARKGANTLGYDSHFISRYVEACRGDGQCLQGCRADRKQSLNGNCLPEGLARGGGVVPCAPVKRVLFEGARAVGVTGRFKHPRTRQRGCDFVLRARKGVLIAASVTRSPLLLAHSGVRLPALGKGFRAHPGAPLSGCYDEPVDMNTGARRAGASPASRREPGFKLESLSLPLDMLAGRMAGTGQLLMQRLTEFRHIAMWIQVCRAESVGQVKRALGGKPAVH